jgi:hypothetical protein
VWYEIPEVWSANYLEDFDTLAGGKNALVVNRTWGDGETFYMLGKDDRVNRFTWGRWEKGEAGYWAGAVDFNGDGIRDYILDEGVVYRGVSKNGPPDPTPVANYKLPAWALMRRSIADFNGDGKEDFMERTVRNPTIDKAPNDVIGQIILGNSDLTKMKVLEMPQIQGTYPGAYSIQNIVSAWRENGKNYMVVYNYTPDGYKPRSDAFELCEFVIVADTTISYTTLDHVPYKAWPDPNTPYYSYSSSFVWHSLDRTEKTLVVYDVDRYYYQTYKYRDGHLVPGAYLRTGAGNVYYMTRGVGSMNQAGWCSETNALLFSNGDPFYGISYYAKVTADGQRGVCSIGDVNNDGFGDVAVIYKSGDLDYRVVLYLGADISTGVVDPVGSTLSMSFGSESPSSNTKPLEVTFIIDKPGNYTITMYSLRGELIATLLNEHFDQGTYTRIVGLPSVAAGLYNVCLTDGTQRVDKGIMITP